MITPTQQMIFLNSIASLLLKQDLAINDTLIIAKDVFNKYDIGQRDIKEVEEDLIDALYNLEAFGLVNLLEKKRVNDSLKIAGERDYSNISKFIINNMHKNLSYVSVKESEYYNAIAVRIRQFNNMEYNITKYKDNKVIFNMVIMPPANESVFTVITINSMVFYEGINNEEAMSILNDVFKFIEAHFSTEYNKIRFLYFNKKYKNIKNILETLGFKQVCIYEKEINKCEDLIIYDKFI